MEKRTMLRFPNIPGLGRYSNFSIFLGSIGCGLYRKLFSTRRSV
jgi:hypothetical protein